MAHDVEHQAGATPKVVEHVHTPNRERCRTGPRRAVAHGVAGTVGTDGEADAVSSSAGARQDPGRFVEIRGHVAAPLDDDGRRGGSFVCAAHAVTLLE